MLSIEKLIRSRLILEEELSIYTKILNFEPKLARIHVILRDKVQLFIRYNNHDEYSYCIIFSQMELDRCRFDNYDDRWDVITRPNHYHPRYNKLGFKSPMNGNPDHDIPKLCELIKSSKLLFKNFKFI